MFIIIIIILIILIAEVYFITLNNIPKNITKTKENKFINVSKDTQGTNLLNQYSIKSDKKINHGPGKLMINKDYNMFINTDTYNKLLEKNIIYNIDVPFELEIVNLSKENINYYYISSE
jgi:hypothetical protein